MYTVSNVLVRKNRRWKNINFNSILISTLILNYTQIYIILIDTATNIENQYSLLDFPQIRLVINTNLTDYFLNYNGAMPQPVVPIKSINNKKSVLYKNIWEFGLQIDRGIVTNTVLISSKNNQPDLIISKPKLYPNELTTLFDKILYLVSGEVIFPSVFNDTVYLKNGGDVLDKNSNKQISIIDFSLLGGFIKVDLTPDILSIFSLDVKSAKISVTLPDSVVGYTPLLVRHGKLHILDNTYFLTDNHSLIISLDYIRIANELLNVNIENINWITPANSEKSAVYVDTIDPIKYLTDGNSALLFLKTNELSIDKYNLARTGFAGDYFTTVIPTGVLLLEDGTIGDYNLTEVTGYGNQVTTTLPKFSTMISDTIPRAKISSLKAISTTKDHTNALATMVNLYTL